MTSTGKKIVSLIDFAISVCKEISEEQTDVQVHAAADDNLSADRLTGRHFLQLIVNNEGKNCSVHATYATSVWLAKVTLQENKKTSERPPSISVRPARLLFARILAWRSTTQRRITLHEAAVSSFYIVLFLLSCLSK